MEQVVSRADAMLQDAALVVAHPDDEILWFSSVIEHVQTVLICYLDVPSRPDWSEGRRRALSRYPLWHVRALDLVESEAFNGADWRAPVMTSYGLEVSRREGSLASFSGETYRDNFERLRQHLREELRGYRNVITHNPWGEYGHEEHVQVYRAVTSLSTELGFDVWFSNYCSNKSHNLMLAHLRDARSDYTTRPANLELASSLKTLYRDHGCWTWFDDYLWFTHECFMRDRPARPEPGKYGHHFPLNYLRIETPWEKAAPPRSAWRAAVRNLKDTARQAWVG
jgi:LmbE family N-acetylglucosaminyl deacetylase